MHRPRVNSKLLKIFLLQVVLISAAASIGIYAAAQVTEKLLVREALEGEAQYFWQRWQTDGTTPVPDTLNLRGYLDRDGSGQAIPAALRGLNEGLHRVAHEGEQPIVYVSQHNGLRLYLLFDEEQVSRLSFFFGIAPLTLVLLVLYALTFFTFLQARRAISPIVRLAQQMAGFDLHRVPLAAPDFSALRRDADAETAALMDAIDAFLDRIRELLVRERNFTRYASHELRTPLAVIKGSVANLAALASPDAAAADKTRRHLQRIDTTVRDMEALLETLLLLAREDELQETAEAVQVNDLAALLVEQLQSQAQPGVTLTLEQRAFLQTRAPQRLVGIVLTNLLRNALACTQQGQVRVRIEADAFSVEDTGIGIAATELERIFDPFFRSSSNQAKGFGLGLAIVRKICDQLGWSIDVRSREGAGSCFEVRLTPPPA